MEWLQLIITAIGGSVTGLIGSIVYFRPKLSEARAGASKAQTEAADARVTYLVERIETAERLYKEQGKALDEVRQTVLKLSQDVQDRDMQILQLKKENNELKEKITSLTQQFDTYKTRGPKK